ncbi:hypothetical protein [Kitasatospora purpeofusca]|uniref:hypothetical protein n=1 Tax=Kitasatospora purpeofusca TaxID=67352 RepID=UPI0036D33F14
MIDVNNYELAWPADLFAAEGNHIAASGRRDWTSRAQRLLTEAFQSGSACSDFDDLPAEVPRSDDPWGQPDPGAWGRASLVVP